MTNSLSVRDDVAITKLWVHEVSRVFHDRLINDIDREWFFGLVMELLTRHFRSKLTRDEIFVKQKILFSDLLRLDVGNKEYEEVQVYIYSLLFGYLGK